MRLEQMEVHGWTKRHRPQAADIPICGKGVLTIVRNRRRRAERRYGEATDQGRASRLAGHRRVAWNGSWNGWPGNPMVLGAAAALSCGIGAGSAGEAGEHASRNALLTEGWHVPYLVGPSWGEATADDHRSGWRSARIRARESCSASTWASLSWTRRRAGTPTPRPFSARSSSWRYRFSS